MLDNAALIEPRLAQLPERAPRLDHHLGIASVFLVLKFCLMREHWKEILIAVAVILIGLYFLVRELTTLPGGTPRAPPSHSSARR